MLKTKAFLQSATTATTLPASRIGGDGGNILNAANLDARAGKSPESRLSTGTRGLGAVTSSCAQLDVQSIDAELLAADGNVLCGKHGSVGRGLITISLHLHATSHADESFLARQIGDVHESVIEGSKDVGNAPNELTLPAKKTSEKSHKSINLVMKMQAALQVKQR